MGIHFTRQKTAIYWKIGFFSLSFGWYWGEEHQFHIRALEFEYETFGIGEWRFALIDIQISKFIFSLVFQD